MTAFLFTGKTDCFDSWKEKWIFLIAWNILAYVHLDFWLIRNILMNVWDRHVIQMCGSIDKHSEIKPVTIAIHTKEYKTVFAAQKNNSVSVAHDTWLILLWPHTTHPSFSSFNSIPSYYSNGYKWMACNFTPPLMTTSRIFNDTCFDLSAFKSFKQGSSRQLPLRRFYNSNRPHHEFYIYACLDTSNSGFVPGATWKIEVVGFFLLVSGFLLGLKITKADFMKWTKVMVYNIGISKNIL